MAGDNIKQPFSKDTVLPDGQRELLHPVTEAVTIRK